MPAFFAPATAKSIITRWEDQKAASADEDPWVGFSAFKRPSPKDIDRTALDRLACEQGVSTQAGGSSEIVENPFGIGEFAWILLEDEPVTATVLMKKMTKLGIKHVTLIQSALQVSAFLRTVLLSTRPCITFMCMGYLRCV